MASCSLKKYSANTQGSWEESFVFSHYSAIISVAQLYICLPVPLLLFGKAVQHIGKEQGFWTSRLRFECWPCHLLYDLYQAALPLGGTSSPFLEQKLRPQRQFVRKGNRAYLWTPLEMSTQFLPSGNLPLIVFLWSLLSQKQAWSMLSQTVFLWFSRINWQRVFTSLWWEPQHEKLS